MRAFWIHRLLMHCKIIIKFNFDKQIPASNEKRNHAPTTNIFST